MPENVKKHAFTDPVSVVSLLAVAFISVIPYWIRSWKNPHGTPVEPFEGHIYPYEGHPGVFLLFSGRTHLV